MPTPLSTTTSESCYKRGLTSLKTDEVVEHVAPLQATLLALRIRRNWLVRWPHHALSSLGSLLSLAIGIIIPWVTVLVTLDLPVLRLVSTCLIPIIWHSVLATVVIPVANHYPRSTKNTRLAYEIGRRRRSDRYLSTQFHTSIICDITHTTALLTSWFATPGSRCLRTSYF